MDTTNRSTTSALTGTAAGVPYVALPPEDGDTPAPLVVTWHLMDSPRSERAMAAALPLAGLRAWRVYLGLPMFGARSPDGGMDELIRLGTEDAVLNVYAPIVLGAMEEFPAALEVLRAELSIVDGPIGLAGGSAGGGVALSVAASGKVDVGAVAVVNALTQLEPVVAATAADFGFTYRWGEESRTVADRIDFVARAAELPANVLQVIGEEDFPYIREPAAALKAELGERGELVTVPGMAHALAEEPGIEPAPQTTHAAAVDAEFAAWFQRHLVLRN